MKISPYLAAAFLAGCGATSAKFQTDPQESFSIVDRAAVSILTNVQQRSFNENREFCGVLGYDDTGTLRASAPMMGDRDGCVPHYSSKIVVVLASYHTHGAASEIADTEAPSATDIIADLSEGIDGYIATPGGRLWKISHDDKTAKLLCEKGCVPRDPRHLDCATKRPESSYTTHTLFERANAHHSACDSEYAV